MYCPHAKACIFSLLKSVSRTHWYSCFCMLNDTMSALPATMWHVEALLLFIEIINTSTV